jgi:two-component system OmpR family sensor kinase
MFTTMSKLRPFFVPILFILAITALSLLFWVKALPDLIITLRMDLGNVLFFTCLPVFILWVCLKLFWNRSQQKSIESVRLDAADEKRSFLRRLDHELKNPLTAIRAGLANLAETTLEEPQRQTLASVEAQTLRMSRLSSDLRKLAELEARPLERSTVNVSEMLQEAFTLAYDHPGAASRDLKLSIPQVPWPLPVIQGDRDLLFLAVHNLLDNAIKFTLPGNSIEMRGYEDGSSLVIEVADTGQGIPDDEIAHVGEELYRGRRARGVPGNGLGLALVHSIINLHGGKVTLRSREGKGTVVTLRLPVNPGTPPFSVSSYPGKNRSNSK